MKRFTKMLGVTLLEILLVLAVAAMIIVMSIRYYQSAATSQQANMAMEQVQALASAMDNLAIGKGTYSSVSATSLTTVMGGAQNMVSPSGNGSVGLVGNPTGSKYVVTIPNIAAAACVSVQKKLSANTKIVNPATCSGTSGSVNLTYTYDNSL